MRQLAGHVRAVALLACLVPGTAALAETVLRVVPSADLAELDPTRGGNQIARIYSQMVFDTLFALDHELAPKPMMVEQETVSADRLTYSFTLRPGLRFGDGTAVTTRDVIASLERWMQGGSIGPQVKRSLASMATVDERRFTMVLTQPFGMLEFALAGPGAPIAAIMREADARRPDGVALTEPVGSGPFRYVAAEREAGHRAVFEKNPYYTPRPEPPDGLAGGKVVKVDRVEWVVIPDATTAANALAKGEVDFWDTVTPDLVPFLRARGATVRRTATLPAVLWVRPNFTLPPFNDVRARQALALLLDQRENIAAVAGGITPAETCFSFSVCGSSFGTEIGADPYRTPDPARAKQLMAEAGYAGQPIVIVSSPQLPLLDALAQVTAQRLRDAGLTVDLQEGDWANQYKRVTTQGLTAVNGGWNLFPSYSLGGTWFNPLTNTALDTGCDGSSVFGWPCDADGERLRQAVLLAPDPASRTAAFATLQRHMWGFIPYVPGGQFDIVNAYGKNVSGVLDGYVIAFWNVEKR